MTREGEKKSILAWISDALYEKVETGDESASPEGGGADRAGPRAAEDAVPAPKKEPLEHPVDLATRLREQVASHGAAFTKFLGLVASFSDIIPDEAGRYRAALKALEKTGGVTAEQVLLAGKDQLQALESQKEVFVEAVSRKRQAMRESGGGVEEIRAKIAELEKSLSTLRAKEQSLLRESTAEEERIKAAEANFSSLLGTLHDEITTVREKLKRYLA